MDCRDARIEIERGRGEAPDVAEHLAACADCRRAVEDVRAAEELLTAAFPAAPAEPDGGEERVLAALRTRVPARRRTWLRVAACLAFVAAGAALGWWIRDGRDAPAPAVAASRAAHERAVFDEIGRGLGGRLRWLATVDGEVVVGLGRREEGELRVLFLQIRDEDGALVGEPRIVLPEGTVVEAAAPDGPAIRVEAGPRGLAACSLRFPDGGRLDAAGATLDHGETILLGEVRTDGATRSVYATLF